MQIVIDIPDEGYDWIKNGFPDNEDKEFLIKAVKNGTPYEERPQGDLISREALKKSFAVITYIRFTADMGQGGFEMFSEKEIENIIDKATTVSDRYAEGYAQGYIDGSTGADWKGDADND